MSPSELQGMVIDRSIQLDKFVVHDSSYEFIYAFSDKGLCPRDDHTIILRGASDEPQQEEN